MDHAVKTLGRAHVLARIVRGDYVENSIDAIQKIRRGPHTEFLAALSALTAIRRTAPILLAEHQAHLDAGAETAPLYSALFRNLDPFLKTTLIGIAREIPTGFTAVSEAEFRRRMEPVRISPALAGVVLRRLLNRPGRAPQVKPAARKRAVDPEPRKRTADPESEPRKRTADPEPESEPRKRTADPEPEPEPRKRTADPEPEPRKRPAECRTIIRGILFRAAEAFISAPIQAILHPDAIRYSVSRHLIIGTPLDHCFETSGGIAMPVIGKKVEIKFDDIETRLEPARRFGQPKNGLYFVVALEHVQQVYGIAVLTIPVRGLRTINIANH